MGRGLKFFLSLHGNTPAKTFINMGPKHAQLLYWNGNFTFILVIIKLCDMLNIKSYGKRSDANCFESISEPRLVWIEKFVLWLHCWNRFNVQHDCGFLSKEIYLALTHTDITFVILIRDLLQHNVQKSILLVSFKLVSWRADLVTTDSYLVAIIW